MDANRAQADYWSSSAGLKWIEHEHALDTGMLGMMLDAADMASTDRVIDVGCGTGASTIETSRRVPDGSVLGIDISDPLLARAARRAEAAGAHNASFLLADAQTHDFRDQQFDLLVSRLGMSFFSDTVAALRNLSYALNDRGRMAFVCWASVARNPWFAFPKEAAERQHGPLAKADPDAPGPTAFQDRDRVTELLARSGLSDIEAHAVDIVLTPPDGPVGAARAASRVGPAARVMKAYGGSDADEAAIEDAVRIAFEEFEDGDAVRVPAVVNLFTCAR